MMYDSSMKYKWDSKNVLDYAVNEGMEKGLQQGDIKGKLEASNWIALELKSQGFAVDFIKNLTYLTTAQIEEL